MQGSLGREAWPLHASLANRKKGTTYNVRLAFDYFPGRLAPNSTIAPRRRILVGQSRIRTMAACSLFSGNVLANCVPVAGFGKQIHSSDF